MLLIIIIALVSLTIYTWARWETVSPKLVVRECFTITGAVVGATPEVTRTTIKVVKAANASAELELLEAGQEGPKGFREGRIVAKRATRSTLSGINEAADASLIKSLDAIKALKEA